MPHLEPVGKKNAPLRARKRAAKILPCAAGVKLPSASPATIRSAFVRSPKRARRGLRVGDAWPATTRGPQDSCRASAQLQCSAATQCGVCRLPPRTPPKWRTREWPFSAATALSAPACVDASSSATISIVVCARRARKDVCCPVRCRPCLVGCTRLPWAGREGNEAALCEQGRPGSCPGTHRGRCTAPTRGRGRRRKTHFLCAKASAKKLRSSDLDFWPVYIAETTGVRLGAAPRGDCR